VLDLLAVAVFRPLDHLRDAVSDTQRLELVHLMCRQRLGECQGYRALRSRIDCQREVWAVIMSGL
jgi:hypothetical protein